jgi:hypothetical protein
VSKITRQFDTIKARIVKLEKKYARLEEAIAKWNRLAKKIERRISN